MELSAYPRHRKRCLNGYRASFRLFTSNSRGQSLAQAKVTTNSPATHQPAQNIISMPFVRAVSERKSVLNDLANEICQEASKAAESRSLAAAALLVQTLIVQRNNAQVSDTSAAQAASVDLDPGKQQPKIYPYGVRVKRNRLGQVTEISSPLGQQIVFDYSPVGVLQSFTRLYSSGKIHSLGKVDHDGVTVMDGAGQLVLVGESMSVSQNGCLIISLSEDEFSSVDLIRGMYTERRLTESPEGLLVSLTAVFAFDGFRMMTFFLAVPEEREQNGDGAEDALLANWRFYGRDGSMIGFDSEEKLKLRQPSYTRSAEVETITSTFEGRVQGYTAWDSVNAHTSADPQYF